MSFCCGNYVLYQAKSVIPRGRHFPPLKIKISYIYMPKNIIPRFQSRVFSVKDEAAIQPEAQEMHFENVNK